MTLHIGLYSDYKTAQKRFNFYGRLDDMMNYRSESDDLYLGGSGLTVVVREKDDLADKGVLILINETFLSKNDYEWILDIAAHEGSHAVDAIWDVIGEPCHDYDNGNEPRAYLAGWVAGRIGSYLTDHFKKKNGRKKVRRG